MVHDAQFLILVLVIGTIRARALCASFWNRIQLDHESRKQKKK